MKRDKISSNVKQRQGTRDIVRKIESNSGTEKRRRRNKKNTLSRVTNNDVLQKNATFKLVVVPCLVAIAVSVGYLFYFNIHNNNVESQVAYIKEYYKNGVINDWQGKLNCKGVKDIKWFRDSKMTEIHFGSVAMSWENEKFLTKANLDLIGQIGFQVGLTKDKKDIVIYWCGQKVERWIK